MNRKVGILTFFESDNSGTFLQAYSMLKALERRLPEDRVELINFRRRRSWFRPHRADLWPPYFIEHLRYYLARLRCRRQYLRRSPGGIVTRDTGRAMAYIEANHYDLIVVGSDTVLKLPPGGTREEPLPVYWLSPSLPCRKVACAASASTLTYDSLGDAMRKKMADAVHAFDLVGVRDDMTFELMGALGLKGDPRLAMVPDPTFTLDFDPKPAETLLRRAGIDPARPTVGIQVPRPSVSVPLARHFKSKGFQIVMLDGEGPADYAPFGVAPFEFAGIYGCFVLTITDRFHGSIFSLLNGTPVVAVDCGRYLPSGLSKTFTLMRQFGCERTHHINLDRVTDPQEVIRIAEAALGSFDAQKVQQTVAEMRSRFSAFLDRVAGVLHGATGLGRA
ncbi:MAG: polysaccharide pyruvyl transferase family protein [Phycisphaerae bacterium]